MPQALAFFLPATFGAGGSLALFSATGALTVGGQIVGLVGGLALNAVTASLFAPDAPSVGPDSIKVNTASDTAVRVKHYGRVRVGYAIIFTRALNGQLSRVIVHGHGPSDQIEAYYLDKGLVALDVDGYVTDAQYLDGSTKKVRILSRLGEVPNAHYPELTAEFVEWTEDHRLDGMTHSLLQASLPPLSKFNAMYPNREPSLEVVLRGSPVLDPRTGLTAYTDNLALCALDYELSQDGGGIGDNVDVASYIAAADASDEQVPLKEGGTEARYRFAGTYDLNEEPRAVRQRFLRACAGENYITPEGKLALRVGEWQEPTFTITHAMVKNLSWEFGSDAIESYNIAAFEYVDPDINFTKVPGDQWRDDERIASQGENLTAPFISAPSHRQCRAVSKILMERENPISEMVIQCKPMGIIGFYEAVARVTLPGYGIDGVYRIKRRSCDPVTLQVTYELAELRRTAFSLSLEEQGTKPTFQALSDSGGVPTPDEFNAAKMTVNGGAGIGAAWNEAPYSSLTAELQYKASADTAWITASVGEGANTALIGGLEDGTLYDVRLAWKTPGEATGEYAQEDAVFAGTVAGTPSAPTGLAVVDQTAGEADVTVTASASDGIWKTEVYRDGVLIFTKTTETAEVVNFTDNPGAGSFTWTARSVNVKGEPGAVTSGETETIT